MITLSTSAYEKDFRHTLNKDTWFYKFQHPLVTKKTVIINNISSVEEFLDLKKEFENDFEFYNSSDYTDQIHETFKVALDPSHRSHFYSIHHYTSILNNSNPYGFHVSPDCWIVGDDLTHYLQDSMSLLDSDETVKSTSIFWVAPEFMESVAENEETYFGIQKKDKKFYFSKVFSDQIYFYKKDKFLQCNFTIEQKLHDCPPYGYNSFEYRLTNHYISYDNYRAIHKSNLYFTHKSF